MRAAKTVIDWLISTASLFYKKVMRFTTSSSMEQGSKQKRVFVCGCAWAAVSFIAAVPSNRGPSPCIDA